MRPAERREGAPAFAPEGVQFIQTPNGLNVPVRPWPEEYHSLSWKFHEGGKAAW
jgi:hypothetical protein